MKKTLTQMFMEEVSKIKDPAMFLGVARVLGVDWFKNPDEKEFLDIFVDAVDGFDKASRKRKKEILKILRKANKCKEVGENGSYTKDTPN